MPLNLDRDAVLKTLNTVHDPKSGQGLSDAGLVKGLVVAGARVGFMIEVEPADVNIYQSVRHAAEVTLKTIPGIEEVRVVLTADAPPAAPKSPQAGVTASAKAQLQAPAIVGTERPAHVRRVIAIGSGKGGVGKSTIAVNLACALAASGLKVGLLDADIYGPSAPLMTGVSGKPDLDADKRIIPHRAHGLKIMSIGLLVEAADAMIWRGPMASGALTQMLNQTVWGSEGDELDVLVIDLPPGTGDVQLTLVQKCKLDGAIIVSTPQEASLADARRGFALFEKVGAPVLGLIENMAYFTDPTTGAPIEIFGRGGVKGEAERLGAPYLGEIPLDPALRIGADTGVPAVIGAAEVPASQALIAMAAALRRMIFV